MPEFIGIERASLRTVGGGRVHGLEYAVEKRVKTIVGPPIWRRITGWHRSKMSAMAHVGYEDSHRTLRLVARMPASDPWVVTDE